VAEVASSAVSLSISGEDLNPAEVTRCLGVQPRIGYRKGETIRLPNGRPGPAGRTGLWSVSVECRKPADIDGQTDELLGLLTDDLAIWGNLATRFHIRLFCGLMLESGNEGFALSPKTMYDLAVRHIAFEADIYSGEDSAEDGIVFD
jgi:hypothetical protein